MKRTLSAFLILLALAGAAHAFGLGLGNRFGKLGAMSGTGGVTPPTSGSALLVNNTDPALLVDGTDPACLVGGC